MKVVKPLVNRLMYGVSISLLFTLNGAAQIVPAEKAAKTEFVVLNDRGDLLPQNDSLTKLTSEEVEMIIRDEARDNPGALAALAGDQEQRKKVLESLKQVLALASEARRTGFADEESIKFELDLARSEAFATAYEDKLKADAGKPGEPGPPFGYLAEREVEAFFAAPANKAVYAEKMAKFFEFIKAAQAKSKVPADISEEQKQYIASQWKKVTYGAVKAEELKLVNRKIELLYKLQQSIVLAHAYSQEKLLRQLTPTDDEIKAYIAANPKFDKSGRRAKADEILAKAKAGGDFAALANQFSEDPGNKDAKTGEGQGGLYDWNSRDRYVKEFSDAAWALDAGQISPIVETQYGYHIIKLEGKRIGKDPDGRDQEEIKVRHILISTTYQGESDSAMPMSMEEGAKQELAKQKEKNVLDDITARNPIYLPPDFTIDASVITEAEAAAANTPPKAKPASPAKRKSVGTKKSVRRGKARTARKKH